MSPDGPPFLILHGEKDPVVPVNQSQLLFEALKKVGVRPNGHLRGGSGRMLRDKGFERQIFSRWVLKIVIK